MSKKAKAKKAEVVDIEKAPAPIVSHEGTTGAALPPKAHRQKAENRFCSKTGVGFARGEAAPKKEKKK